MLKSWSIKNFKPIVDSGELRLAPVTVFAGRNSSGKSSLLQSILMIAQTLGSRLLDRPLLPNERLVQLGTFDDILNDFCLDKYIDVYFELSFSSTEKFLNKYSYELPREFKSNVYFSSENGRAAGLSAIEAYKVFVSKLTIHLFSEELDLFLLDDLDLALNEDEIMEIVEEAKESVEIDFNLKKMTATEVETFLRNTAPERLQLLRVKDSHYLGEFDSFLDEPLDEPYLVELSHFLPSRFMSKFNIAERRKTRIERYVDLLFSFGISFFTSFPPERYSPFIDFQTTIPDELKREISEIIQNTGVSYEFSGRTIEDLASWYIALKNIIGGKKASIGRKLRKCITQYILTLGQNEYKDNLEDLEEVTNEEDVGELKQIIDQVTRYFSNNIRYLGPLRADPGVIQQQFAPAGELDNVGIKGEYAAMVYHTNRDALIDWYNPQKRRVETTLFPLALDAWAQYLNIAEEAGTIGITWQIVSKEGQRPRRLPEVGVGISQILPILVMGLLSPANSLLIIEQPELHLHPFVQARLGDFFMGLAKCKKQCLIETHSENLVSQLRLHIVEAGGLEKSDCMIYFVDRDEKGAAKFEKVEISPNGNILNWPEGFFDETMLQEDRITAASLRKRAQKAKHGS